MTSPMFGERIKTGLDGVEKLIIDMKDLEYISSAGLRILLQAQKIMSTRGGMKVIHVNDVIMDVLTATGFTDILTIE